MAMQTYNVLFPVAVSGTVYTPSQGGQAPVTVQLDDQDPTTQSLITAGWLVLSSAPNAAQMASQAAALIAAQQKGPGEANTPPGQFD